MHSHDGSLRGISHSDDGDAHNVDTVGVGGLLHAELGLGELDDGLCELDKNMYQIRTGFDGGNIKNTG